MKLPVLDTFAFPVNLPSSNTSISMRPYLVREEKLLLMAQESESYEEQAEAVAQIIRNCTNGEVEPKVAPFFDIEYLLLQLRSRSVGEIATPIYECHNKLEDGTECKNRTPMKINLSQVAVSNLNPDASKFVIAISPRYTLKLRYPTIFTINELFLASMNKETARQSKIIDSLVDLFDELIDHESGVTYRFSDFNVAEKIEFMEGLSPSDYDKLISFIEEMPTLRHKMSYTCEKCKFVHEIELKGLADFLAWG